MLFWKTDSSALFLGRETLLFFQNIQIHVITHISLESKTSFLAQQIQLLRIFVIHWFVAELILFFTGAQTLSMQGVETG